MPQPPWSCPLDTKLRSLTPAVATDRANLAADPRIDLVAVAVPVPLRQTFLYRLHASDVDRVKPGTRLRVPFGRRHLEAVALETPYRDFAPAFACRLIDRVIDEPPMPADVLALCCWAADYYHHAIGEVIAAALPAGSAHTTAAAARTERWFRLTSAGATAIETLPARSSRLRAALEALRTTTLPGSGLDIASAGINRALEQGWIEETLQPPAAPPTIRSDRAGAAAVDLPALTEEQAAILTALSGAGPKTATGALLDGVTGSGKTEVYLRLAAEAIASGRQVLVLTPEIGLTPQLVDRFRQRFGERVAAYHSALGDGERRRNWRAAAHGEVDIVVGTRSAVFVPLARPGLIIVDEEHDPSYKQAEGFRYSARDLAVVRASQLRIPLLLGSATPSLESLQQAQSGRYRLLKMIRRVLDTPLPRIRVVDMRRRASDHGLSAPLLDAVEAELADGGQALLFLNRRGYAPVLRCKVCGWLAPCTQCDARLVLHRGANRLLCHHCGLQAPIPSRCPDCGGRGLEPIGQGTERIEDTLLRRFPGRRVERLDSDRLRRISSAAALFADIHAGRVPLLVGTQVLAKGHDFPGLGFAGLVDVDSALYGGDFRAVERMGQLITQVAGRVGRHHRRGEVVLQTYHPEHPLLRTLIERGHPAFAAALLDERRALGLPPFAHLALLRASSPQPGAAMAFLDRARARLPPTVDVAALGPTPAIMEKRAGRHRAQLLLKSLRRPPLHRLLKSWLLALDSEKLAADLRWSLDVDPGDLY